MKYFLLLFFSVCLFIHCLDNNDCNAKGVTYDEIVQSIFEESCNNESCHPGLSGGWQVLADFSTYDKLLPHLESGEIENRINTNDLGQKMPPESWPEKTISQEDLDLLNAWLCNGFPEN